MIKSCAVARIIPARAGFTLKANSTAPLNSDHPRSRGVYSSHTTWHYERQGSSPLARGLLHRVPLRRRYPGMIPARAGFTQRPGSTWSPSRDHPRSRGVYLKTTDDAQPDAGSSPLARGLQALNPLFEYRSRIIPARAGFTRRDEGRRQGSGDHPRSRGVYLGGLTVEDAGKGSSPLARGLHDPRVPGELVEGIIPARAGFTLLESQLDIVTRDHPRSRGVYRTRGTGPRQRRGSSPLARGLL